MVFRISLGAFFVSSESNNVVGGVERGLLFQLVAQQYAKDIRAIPIPLGDKGAYSVPRNNRNIAGERRA